MDIQAAIQGAVHRLEATGLDDFEVLGLTESSLIIEAKRQMIETFCRSRKNGIAIRAMKDGRMSFVTTSDCTPKSITQAVKEAHAALKHIDPSEDTCIPAPQKPQGSLIEKTGRSLSEIPDDEKMRAAMTLECAAIAADNRVMQVQHPRLEEKTHTLTVVNSKGINVEGTRGLVRLELKAVATDGEDTESAYESEFSPRFEDIDAEDLARRAAKRAVSKLGAKPLGTGLRRAILDPRAAAVMLSIAAPSFFADNVQLGKSALASKKGERAYSPMVTICDDGLRPYGFASFPFDGEGIFRRRTAVVASGVIVGWLYDGARATRDNVQSTGNCVRDSIRRLPVIGVSNCFLEPANKSPDELVREAGEGIMVTGLLGVHTANTITGDFSLGVEGLLIEDGALSIPVRGMTIAGNIHELLERVVGVGNDLRFFDSYGAPSILVDGIMFGG